MAPNAATVTTANRLLPVANEPTAQRRTITGITEARGARSTSAAMRIIAMPSGIMMILDNEDDVERVHAGRPLSEERRARIEPLHVENADRDGGDGVAGNAEQQRWHPARGEARVVAGPRFDQSFRMARAEFLRLFRKAFRHGIADPGRHVGPGAGQHTDDDA